MACDCGHGRARRYPVVHRGADGRADALFHDLGAAVGGGGDLVGAAGAAGRGRKPATEDRPGSEAVSDRLRHRRGLYRLCRVGRLRPNFSLPHAVLLAVSVGVLELVPVIGPFASATMVGLIALQQNAIWSAAPLLGFVILLRLSIDNLVGPLVLGEAARVPPVVIIISFVCGAILFGVVGLLLAVPAVVCVKVTLEQYYAEPVAAETTGSRTGGAE